jgi:glycosyltransferase involved in cell wall biosynthesis
MKERLDILQVIHGFSPNSLAGTETHTIHLSQELQNSGHRVSLFFPRLEERGEYEIEIDEYEGIKVFLIKMPPPSTLIECLRNEKVGSCFRDLLIKNPFDIIHFQHLLYLTPRVIEIAKEMKIPTVLTLHDLWFICREVNFRDGECEGPESVDKCVRCYCEVNRKKGLTPKEIASIYYYKSYRFEYFRSILSLVDVVISPSIYVKNRFERFGFSSSKIRILHLGLKPFDPIPKKEGGEGIHFGFIGKLTKVKGVDLLLEAFGLVGEGARLSIYGRSYDHSILQRIIQHGEKRPGLRYEGPYNQEDLPRIFSQIDIAISPSRWESYSLMVRESLQAKTPVIVSNIEAHQEIVEDGKNGLLFRSEDPFDLYAKMKAVLDNPSIIKKLREGIRPVKTINENALELEEEYYRLLNE